MQVWGPVSRGQVQSSGATVGGQAGQWQATKPPLQPTATFGDEQWNWRCIPSMALCHPWPFSYTIHHCGVWCNQVQQCCNAWSIEVADSCAVQLEDFWHFPFAYAQLPSSLANWIVWETILCLWAPVLHCAWRHECTQNSSNLLLCAWSLLRKILTLMAFTRVTTLLLD